MLTSLSPMLISLLVGTPMLIAVGQIIFKQAGVKFADSGAPFHMIAFEPLFIAACALYGIATFMWVYVLKTVPLSFAYSFMALSYALVPLLAWQMLGEPIGLKYIIGTALIMAGLFIVQS